MPDFDVFLSCHWRDHAVVTALTRRQRQNDQVRNGC
jgi:hypothetical protein